MGPVWEKSAAVFISEVLLPPGRSWMNLELACEDRLIADNYAVFILEDKIAGGPIGQIEPLWRVREYNQEYSASQYKVVKNFGSKPAVVPIVSVIRAESVGETKCTLHIGDPKDFQSTELNVQIESTATSVRTMR